MQEQLKELLFEKELEDTLKKYFKKGLEISHSKVSPITKTKLTFQGATLMSLFSVQAEMEVFNILKAKYGNRVKHIGGAELSDIVIDGLELGFNVKVQNINSCSSIKMFSPSRIQELKDSKLNYRFIIIQYSLSNNKESIKIEDIHLIDYKYLTEVMNEYESSVVLNNGSMYKYIDKRNQFIKGDSEEFNKLEKETTINKLELVKRMYEDFSNDQLAEINSIKELKDYLEANFNITRKLASDYISKCKR